MVKKDRSSTSNQMEAAHLAAIIDSSDDAIITKDINGTITSWNRAAERMFGYNAEEVIGQPATMLIPEGRLEEEPGILARVRRGEKVDHYETIRRRKDGSLVPISLSVSPIFDQAGRVVGASKIVHDISDRKAAEVEGARLAAIVESSDDAIVSKDLNGIIRTWNRGAERIFGYTPEEAVGQPVTMLIPEERTNEEPEILRRIRRGERVDHYETVRRRKDGSLLEISLTVSPIRDRSGQVIGASKIARDITESKRADRASRDAEVMRRVLEAQEAERHKLARDLHDHLGQRMTGLRFKLESLIESCEGDKETHRKAIEVREIAAQVDQDIGYLSWELRPTELEQVGLEDAIRSFVREWSNQYGIAADFHSDQSDESADAARLSTTAETNLYRIVQEALNNVLKHAQAKSVNVILRSRRNDTVLVIEDDGCGFDTETVAADDEKLGGHGLVGMRERAAMLGGTLEIESHRNKGTTILVRIPLP